MRFTSILFTLEMSNKEKIWHGREIGCIKNIDIVGWKWYTKEWDGKFVALNTIQQLYSFNYVIPFGIFVNLP